MAVQCCFNIILKKVVYILVIFYPYLDKLQFATKPPSYSTYASVISVLLNCSAYGEPEQLLGKWTSLIGHGNLSYTVIKSDNSISVSQRVSSNGTYKCEIIDKYSKIETTAIIRFIPSG